MLTVLTGLRESKGIKNRKTLAKSALVQKCAIYFMLIHVGGGVTLLTRLTESLAFNAAFFHGKTLGFNLYVRKGDIELSVRRRT